jgi:hypothetical protein
MLAGSTGLEPAACILLQHPLLDQTLNVARAVSWELFANVAHFVVVRCPTNPSRSLFRMTRWRSLIVARAWLSQQREGSEQDDKRSQHELSFRAVDEESNGAARDPVLAKDRLVWKERIQRNGVLTGKLVCRTINVVPEEG